jgi:hypothetical protein
MQSQTINLIETRLVNVVRVGRKDVAVTLMAAVEEEEDVAMDRIRHQSLFGL